MDKSFATRLSLWEAMVSMHRYLVSLDVREKGLVQNHRDRFDSSKD